MNSILEKYKKHFPSNEIPKLYAYQESVLEILLSKKNTLSIIPTGGGKSLIFQLAALEFPGTTIVISPLLALIQEQKNYLVKKGINAMTINSDLTFLEQREIYRNLGRHNPKLLYVSPERLQNYYFKSALAKSGLKISMVVIDEAHCISQWGIDFRPEYSLIPQFIDFLNQNGNKPVVFALTATLSKEPRKDIIEEFKIETTSVIVNDDVIRDNLKLNFKEVKKEEEKLSELVKFINDNNSKKVLVYLYNRKQCEELSKDKSLSKFRSSYFHSGLDVNEKNKIYENFRNGKIRILFSTTAFGMGMNIPDIDAIVHYHLPGSIEEYYQHVGRGARNKLMCPEANCLVIWSKENFKVKDRRIRKNLIDEKTLNKAIDLMDLRDKKDTLTNIDYQNYKAASINLPLIKNLFEKYKVIETLGEVHGTPKTIRLYKSSKFWNEIVKSTELIDSFTYASNKTNYTILEIINFIYDEDLKGNVEFLPALGKKIIVKSKYNKIPKSILQKIINEVSDYVKYQRVQLVQLRSLFDFKTDIEIKKFIAATLGVNLKK